MRFKKQPKSAWGWFVISMIPFANLVWQWEVSKLIANVDDDKK